MSDVERCVCCGAIIPEGQIVCRNCLLAVKNEGQQKTNLKERQGEKMNCIKDSGERMEFETGAVRDIQKGKGRCDLMPLDVVGGVLYGDDATLMRCIYNFQKTGDVEHLYVAARIFAIHRMGNVETMLLEVSKHFEHGADKYGENNWQKGLPVKCYINSAVRHLLKWLRGDNDEPHDRAFCWNIMCAIWTCNHKPELNDYNPKKV